MTLIGLPRASIGNDLNLIGHDGVDRGTPFFPTEFDAKAIPFKVGELFEPPLH